VSEVKKEKCQTGILLIWKCVYKIIATPFKMPFVTVAYLKVCDVTDLKRLTLNYYDICKLQQQISHFIYRMGYTLHTTSLYLYDYDMGWNMGRSNKWSPFLQW
jgi:hypothetical protein